MYSKKAFWIRISGLLLASIFLAIPAYALRVYVNPSIQTGNYSPDGAYQEAGAMQNVAAKLVNKLTSRGIEARNSGWLSLTAAATDSNGWGSDCFVALHTDAGAGGWTSAHGTTGLYYYNNGYYNSNCWSFANLCATKVVEQYYRHGRGYTNGLSGRNDVYVINPSYQRAVPTALIEGLFHTNYDDVYGALITEEGKDSYAQGVFQGICEYYGIYYAEDGPAACSTNSNRIDVVWRGYMNRIYLKTWISGTGWTSPGYIGSMLTNDTPAIVSRADGILDVFARGYDNQLYQCHYENGSWGGWVSLGGTLLSGPSACSMNANHWEVVYRGSDNQVRYLQWNNGTYTYGLYGGYTYDQPAIVSRTPTTKNVFFRGTNNQLYYNFYDGQSWSNWSSLGGSLRSGPAVTSRNTGNLEIVYRGPNNSLWFLAWNNGVWSYGDLGGAGPSVPGICSLKGWNTACVYWRSGTYMYEKQYSPNSGWYDFTYLWPYY